MWAIISYWGFMVAFTDKTIITTQLIAACKSKNDYFQQRHQQQAYQQHGISYWSKNFSVTSCTIPTNSQNHNLLDRGSTMRFIPITMWKLGYWSQVRRVTSLKGDRSQPNLNSNLTLTPTLTWWLTLGIRKRWRAFHMYTQYGHSEIRTMTLRTSDPSD